MSYFIRVFKLQALHQNSRRTSWHEGLNYTIRKWNSASAKAEWRSTGKQTQMKIDKIISNPIFFGWWNLIAFFKKQTLVGYSLQNMHKTELGRKLTDFSRRAQQDYKEFLFIPIEWNKTTAYNKRVSAARKKARLEKEGVSHYRYKNVTTPSKQSLTNFINENRIWQTKLSPSTRRQHR